MFRYLMPLILFMTFQTLNAQEMSGPSVSTVGKIAESDDLVRPLVKGDSIPDGELQTLEGKTVHLKDLVAQKPTILIFYRGSWCPFCNMHLYKLQAIESDLRRIGFQILAISPDNAYHLKEMIKRNELTYTLLSDRTMELTKNFGLAYRVSDEMIMNLRKYGHNLEDSTGNSLRLLPVPAAYVVTKSGKIVYSYYNANFQKRVNPEALLIAAKMSLSEQ